VEERGRARSVTQRRFGEEPGSDGAPPAPASPSQRAPPLPASSASEISREPSDLELRERQMRWLRERDRFLARSPAGAETEKEP